MPLVEKLRSFGPSYQVNPFMQTFMNLMWNVDMENSDGSYRSVESGYDRTSFGPSEKYGTTGTDHPLQISEFRHMEDVIYVP